jgi:UDP-N-acetyl-D-glucosamine dehydrogenase
VRNYHWNASLDAQVLFAQLADALNDSGKPLRGSKILLLGLAYKANVDDDRESPSYVLMEKLAAKGAKLAYYDPFIPGIRPSREHGHWASGLL